MESSIYNLIQRATKAFLTLYLLLLMVSGVSAQNSYPIYVTPNLTPPYSLKLSDYSKFGSQSLVVNITVNDLSISNLPVKLHIKLETVGVTIENIPNLGTTPIYLDGGAAITLMGDDLKDYFDINNLSFKGYSKEAYRRTGQLPEGFYKITVEVRHFQTNRLISNRGTASAWIAIGKPPVLKLPENNKELGEFMGMPLTFSWYPTNLGSPISAGSVQYKFEMWELRVDGVSPYTVAATVPTFHEETTQNTLLSIVPASMLMTPGMKYAWRVTASDLSGLVPFEGDGHSEIRVFTYKSKCETAKNLKSKVRGVNGIFAWEPAPNHTSYNVELRRPETGWLSASEAFDSKAEFFDLDYGTKYELRVQSVCDNDPGLVSDFTEWVKLQTPEKRTKPDSISCPGCGCGTPDGAGGIENLTVRKDLKPGDTLVNRFGTTRFIVKSVEQTGDGVYKGQFYFWAEIWKLKFICEYWDLSVNTDNVILNMDFQSVYNPQYLLDVDATTDYLNNLADAITELTVTAKIKDTLSVNETITSIYVNDDGELIAVTTGEDGAVNEVVIGKDTDDIGETLIKGKNGEEYVVTRDGEIMGPKEYKRTGGGNGRKLDDYIQENEKNHLSSGVQVNFAASQNQKYGFDAYNSQKETIKSKYPALGNGYIPAYKSVASFTTDRVVPSTAGNGITFRDGMGIPAIQTGDELTIRGGSDGAVTALYAYKAVTDTTEEIAGKLNLMSFDEQAKKLYIVSVNGAKTPSTTELQNVLNKIYAQAVTRWEVVKIDKNVEVTFPNGGMTHGGSSAISVYNADQKSIIGKFKESDSFEKDAYYLFFIENVKGKFDEVGDVAGFMPLQRQAGFIYDNPNPFIVAHELAHGAFNLRHTFSPSELIADKNSTKNLMDYSGSTELWQHQWGLIHDPENMLFAWAQDEREGEMKDDRNIVITKSNDFLPSINNLDVEFKINHGNIGVVTAQILNASKVLMHEEVFPTPIKTDVNYVYTWDGKMNKLKNDLISEENFIVSIIQGSKEITHPDLFGKTKDDKEIVVDYTKVLWERSIVKTWACINSNDFKEYKVDLENKVYGIGFDLLNIDADSPYRKNPLKYVEDNIVETSFLNNKIYVHKKFAEELNQIEKSYPDLQSLSVQISSSFRIGNTTGKDKLSDHCLGLAIDLNPSENPFLLRKCKETNYVDVLNTIDLLCQISTGNSIIGVKDPIKLSEISRTFLEKYKIMGSSSKNVGEILSSNYGTLGMYLAGEDIYTYKNLSEEVLETNLNLLISNFNSEKITDQEFCDQLRKTKEKLIAFEMFNSAFEKISFFKGNNLSAYTKLNNYISNTKISIDALLSSHNKPLNGFNIIKDNGIEEFIVCFNKLQSLITDFKTFGSDVEKIVSLGKDRGALVFEKGFFNIDLDLMKYLLESGKLDWGASYYDYMHFNFKKSNLKQ